MNEFTPKGNSIWLNVGRLYFLKAYHNYIKITDPFDLLITTMQDRNFISVSDYKLPAGEVITVAKLSPTGREYFLCGIVRGFLNICIVIAAVASLAGLAR